MSAPADVDRPHVLVLGGTAEARALAAALVADGVAVTSSLAGRVSQPRLPVGEVRIGGFGGASGLAAWIEAHRPAAVVDATHPFAARMSRNAAQAAAATGVPLARLARPGWSGHERAGEWTWVADVPAAIDAADAARRPLVTTGRQSVGHYLSAWAHREVVLRIVEPLTDPAPPAWTVLRSRGPYDLPGERELMREQRADHLVTKDSGGTFTAPKLEAAAELGIPVVVVARPDPVVGVEQRTDVAGTLDWVARALRG